MYDKEFFSFLHLFHNQVLKERKTENFFISTEQLILPESFPYIFAYGAPYINIHGAPGQTQPQTSDFTI